MEELDNLSRHIQNTLINNLFTFLPGIVEDTTDFEKDQTISVRPTISKHYSDGVTLKPSVLYKVPLILPSAGGALLNFPISKGDTVALIFSCRDIDGWLGGDGDVVTPNSSRSHNISDAVAIPGLYPFSKNIGPSSTDVFLDFSDSRITLKESGGISIKSTGAAVEVSGDSIILNGGVSGGVVCQNHVCAFTGSPHPQGSTTILGGD